MNSSKTLLYGLPVLSHLNPDTVSSFYRLLFLTSLFTADEADKLLRQIFENKNPDTELAELMENLNAAMNFDLDNLDSVSDRFDEIQTKLREWTHFFPEVTPQELDEYFKYYNLDSTQIQTILLNRNFDRFNSPTDIKMYLDGIVIGQEEAKKVLSFGFYLHMIRVGKIKPVIYHNRKVNPAASELPKPNLLLLGPTGSGKTLIIKSLCNLFNIPFVKVDCSSLTSSGYIGNSLNDYLKILISKYGVDETEKAVVYFDEFDKVSEHLYGRQGGSVGGVELQQEFLALLEDKDRVITRTGYESGEKHQILNTQNIMFIFSGSFAGIEPIIEKRLGEKHGSLGFKKNGQHLKEESSILHKVNFDDIIHFGIIPELAGRIGFIGVLNKLTKEDLIKIMKNSTGNILSQYNNFFLFHFDKLVIEDNVYELIAEEVVKRNIGARALNGVIIELLRDMLFRAPNEFEEVFTVDKKYFLSKFN